MFQTKTTKCFHSIKQQHETAQHPWVMELRFRHNLAKDVLMNALRISSLSASLL